MKKNIVIIVLLLICTLTIVYLYSQLQNQKQTTNLVIETSDSLRAELTKLKNEIDQNSVRAQQLLVEAQKKVEEMKAK